MAARTGIGVGMGVTITLLGLTTLALFVLTFVFLSGKQNAERTLDERTKQIKEFVKENEQKDDNFKKIASEAGTVQKSAMGYLKDSLADIANRIGAKGSDTPKEILAKIDAALKESGQPSLLSAMTDKDSRLAMMKSSSGKLEAERNAALEDRRNSSEVLRSQKGDFDKSVAGLLNDYGRYKGDVEAFRLDIDKFKTAVNDELERSKRDNEDKVAELNNRLAKQAEELAIARGIIARLTSERKSSAIRPGDEYALVDGEVIGIDPVDGDVLISRGRKHKIVVGMTFEVFNDAGSIKPDERGEYNRGKATLEVKRIDESTSTCRVVRNPRGNPVIKGDVIANPIYDPAKRYTFLIYGNFDTDRDGVETPTEGQDIKALIAEWGGRTVDGLAGDVDFLIMGARPILPPPPPVTAPNEVVLAFIAQNRVVQEYDRIQQQAAATSIPILNQNRLYTLLGKN
ncbi:MAG: hypothetical protein ACT4PL_04700 [Phycisphaerales bacterium]